MIEDVQVHDCRTGIGWFDFTRAATQTLVIRRTAVWGVLDTGIYVDFVGANSRERLQRGPPLGVVRALERHDRHDERRRLAGFGVAFASPQSGYRSTATFENNVVTGNQGTSVALEFYKQGGDVAYSGRHNVYWNTGGRTQINAAGRWLTRSPAWSVRPARPSPTRASRTRPTRASTCGSSAVARRWTSESRTRSPA